MSTPIEITNSFRKVLNSHGYGFQYAVLNRIMELGSHGECTWKFETSEHPVEVRGFNTKIDFVLRNAGCNDLLIAECKRVNPKYSNWCFIRVPKVRWGDNPFALPVDEVSNDRGYVKVMPVRLTNHESVVNLWMEVDSNPPRENAGKESEQKHKSGRGAIEDALTQLMRGVNGMANLIPTNARILGSVKKSRLIPVLFTTAKLWMVPDVLDGTNLLTGDIPSLKECEPKPWLPLVHNVSVGLRQEVWKAENLASLSEVVEQLHQRVVFVVSAEGIGEFFRWLDGYMG